MLANDSKSITLTGDFNAIVDSVRSALSEQGFGVITEIDVQATMAEKLGETYEPFLILGACNPTLAHGALQADRSVGTLLPCNVVVRREGDITIVETLDPQIMVRVSGTDELAPVAGRAAELLQAMLDNVQRAEAAE